MRGYTLFLISIIFVLFLSAAAIAADNYDETSITITGGKATADEFVTIDISKDISVTGYIFEEDGTVYANKGSEILFTPTPYEVTIWRLKSSRNIFGMKCALNNGDKISVETLRGDDASKLELRAGERATATWRTERQPPRRHRQDRPRTITTPPQPPTYNAAPEGATLRLFWTGEFDQVPIIDPGFVIWWEYVPGFSSSEDFQKVQFQSELWGIERLPNSTKNTDQPSIPLGYSAPEEELMLMIDRTIPAGEITLYLLDRGVSILQAGNCPRAEMRKMKKPKPHSAVVTPTGEWIED
jgi:hypothetical protein